MGYSSWMTEDWDNYINSRGYTSASTTEELYTANTIKKEFDPKLIKIRESCDSENHPDSSPVIVGLDVTGSMSGVLNVVSKKVNTLMTEVFNRKPIKDPQIMFMAIGDSYYDDFPLQVTQFETDIRIAEQLNDIYFECGGGGNGGESYLLSWYFAARHTKIDSLEKRNQKGFLFTIGDERCLPVLPKEHVKKFINDDVERDLTAKELLTEVSRKYEVYHLIVDPVFYQKPLENWKELLGKNVIVVENIDKIPEIIISILELHAGKDVKTVTESWDGSTAVVVNNAIKDIVISKDSNELIEF